MEVVVRKATGTHPSEVGLANGAYRFFFRPMSSNEDSLLLKQIKKRHSDLH